MTERDILIALYDATNGDAWTNNSNWCSDADVTLKLKKVLEKENRKIIIHAFVVRTRASGLVFGAAL